MKKVDPLVRFSLLAISLLALLSSVRPEGVCVSKGGRFSPYSSKGKPPRKATKGPKDLTLCRVFRKKTCCDVSQTLPALITVRKLSLTGEANEECVNLWELLECSICDPRVGVQPGLPVICASLCDRVFDACSDAYFSMDAMSQVMVPCGTNEIICAKASKWVSNGTDLCMAAGFSVKRPDDMDFGLEKSFCYGGKASLDSIADSWKASKSDIPQKPEKVGGLEDLLQQVKEMPLSMKVYWAVGGMVLTAGLLILSKRKSHSQRKKVAAIQHAAKKIETTQVNPKSSKSWKGKGRRLCD